MEKLHLLLVQVCHLGDASVDFLRCPVIPEWLCAFDKVVDMSKQSSGSYVDTVDERHGCVAYLTEVSL